MPDYTCLCRIGVHSVEGMNTPLPSPQRRTRTGALRVDRICSRPANAASWAQHRNWQPRLCRGCAPIPSSHSARGIIVPRGVSHLGHPLGRGHLIGLPRPSCGASPSLCGLISLLLGTASVACRRPTPTGRRTKAWFTGIVGLGSPMALDVALVAPAGFLPRDRIMIPF